MPLHIYCGPDTSWLQKVCRFLQQYTKIIKAPYYWPRTERDHAADTCDTVKVAFSPTHTRPGISSLSPYRLPCCREKIHNFPNSTSTTVHRIVLEK